MSMSFIIGMGQHNRLMFYGPTENFLCHRKMAALCDLVSAALIGRIFRIYGVFCGRQLKNAIQ